MFMSFINQLQYSYVFVGFAKIERYLAEYESVAMFLFRIYA